MQRQLVDSGKPELKDNLGKPGLILPDGTALPLSISRVVAAIVCTRDGPYEDAPQLLLETVASLLKADVEQDSILALPGSELKDGVIYVDNMLYIPKDQALRTEIMSMHHDDPLAGHFGRDKTLELIRRKYYWPSMANDVEEYCATCQICQKTKTKRHKPYGELNSLPFPKRP